MARGSCISQGADRFPVLLGENNRRCAGLVCISGSQCENLRGLAAKLVRPVQGINEDENKAKVKVTRDASTGRPPGIHWMGVPSRKSLPCESLGKFNSLARSHPGKWLLPNGLPSERAGQERLKDLCVALEATWPEAKGNSRGSLRSFWQRHLHGKTQGLGVGGGGGWWCRGRASNRAEQPRPESPMDPGPGRQPSGRWT